MNTYNSFKKLGEEKKDLTAKQSDTFLKRKWTNFTRGVCAVPPNCGELSLLLHLLGKDLQLLLERLFVVVGVDIVIVWYHRRQELGTGKAEQLLKHSQISEMEQ